MLNDNSNASDSDTNNNNNEKLKNLKCKIFDCNQLKERISEISAIFKGKPLKLENTENVLKMLTLEDPSEHIFGFNNENNDNNNNLSKLFDLSVLDSDDYTKLLKYRIELKDNFQLFDFKKLPIINNNFLVIINNKTLSNFIEKKLKNLIAIYIELDIIEHFLIFKDNQSLKEQFSFLLTTFNCFLTNVKNKEEYNPLFSIKIFNLEQLLLLIEKKSNFENKINVIFNSDVSDIKAFENFCNLNKEYTLIKKEECIFKLEDSSSNKIIIFFEGLNIHKKNFKVLINRILEDIFSFNCFNYNALDIKENLNLVFKKVTYNYYNKINN